MPVSHGVLFYLLELDAGGWVRRDTSRLST